MFAAKSCLWLGSIRKIRFAPPGYILALFLAQCPAFPQDPRIQALEDKLRQLEQTMIDVRREIADLRKPEAPATAPLPAKASNSHIGEATRHRETASQNEVSAPRIHNEPIEGTRAGYLVIPGTGTLFKPSGFIKTDFLYDLKYAGQRYGLYVPSLFPSTTQPPAKSTTVSARPSRLAFEFLQRAGDSDAKAYIELDFLGGFDRNSPRVRHVYGQYKNILAGQTWSLFVDPDAFPDTLEFEGPPSIIYNRQAQIRYTHPVNKHNSIAFSVERSGPDIQSTTPLGTATATSDVPDLLFSYRHEGGAGHLQATLLYRRVGGFLEDSPDPRFSAVRNAYGLMIGTSFNIKADHVIFQGAIGNGITNYFNDNTGLGLDVGFNAAGRLVAVPSGGIVAGYTHRWSRLFRSSLNYGRLQINSAAESPGTTYKVSNYFTGNLIAQPRPTILFGGEFIYGWLERKNGFKYIAPRIQLSATYYFNKQRE